MMDTVVFDVGGVLCPNPVAEFHKVDREHGLPAGTIMSQFRGGSDFARCETGHMPVDSFYRKCVERIAAEHGIDVPAQRLHAMMEACMGEDIRPEMRRLVINIKSAGYQTALLTNIFAERREWLHSIFPDGTIDVFGDSSEMGLRKPDPAIYEQLLEKLDRRPEDVAFVDDFAENLVPARSMGMTTILFESPGQVHRALVDAGFDISPL